MMASASSLPSTVKIKHVQQPTAAAPASEGEAVVQSPTNMAVAKIVSVDFIDLY